MSAHPEIILIAAVARNGVIGRDNGLPWRLKADLAHFKAITLGHTLLMGRKTWESLPRALPQRRHLVVTHDTGYQAAGAEVYPSPQAAIAAAGNIAQLFVIGGEQIYRQLMPAAQRLLLTQVHAEVAGDAHFPPIDTALFAEVERTPHPADADNDYAFDFVEYRRR